MTPEDSDRLIDALTVLAEYYEKPKSETQIQIYVNALQDLPILAVLNAIREHVNQSAFFPKVSEIRGLVEGHPGDAAEYAWARLLREIRQVGYTGTPELDTPTREAVHALWGSWVALCQTLPADGPELLGWAKQFKAMYRVMGDRSARELIAAESRRLLA